MYNESVEAGAMTFVSTGGVTFISLVDGATVAVCGVGTSITISGVTYIVVIASASEGWGIFVSVVWDTYDSATICMSS